VSEENKAIIRRLYDEAIGGGNLSLIDELYAHDVELHVPGLPEDPYGPESIKRMYQLIRDVFPQIRVTIEDLVAENDKVVANVVFRGPHLGRGQGTSARNPLVTWARIDIYRLFQGRIVEQWADRNDTGALQQLGIS
jgi:predicted ester cyclase